MQLVHLIVVTYFIVHYDRKDPVQLLDIAMSVSYVVSLCLAAVFLWGVYAAITFTPWFNGVRASGKALLLIGITTGLTVIAYTALVLFGLAFMVLHAPH